MPLFVCSYNIFSCSKFCSASSPNNAPLSVVSHSLSPNYPSLARAPSHTQGELPCLLESAPVPAASSFSACTPGICNPHRNSTPNFMTHAKALDYRLVTLTHCRLSLIQFKLAWFPPPAASFFPFSHTWKCLWPARASFVRNRCSSSKVPKSFLIISDQNMHCPK